MKFLRQDAPPLGSVKGVIEIDIMIMRIELAALLSSPNIDLWNTDKREEYIETMNGLGLEGTYFKEPLTRQEV